MPLEEDLGEAVVVVSDSAGGEKPVDSQSSKEGKRWRSCSSSKSVEPVVLATAGGTSLFLDDKALEGKCPLVLAISFCFQSFSKAGEVWLARLTKFGFGGLIGGDKTAFSVCVPSSRSLADLAV